MQWDTADHAIEAGVDETTARSFLQPDGILTRMRALACGWTKPGDKLRDPSDRAWWSRTYAFPLWNPLATYVDRISNVTPDAVRGTFDEALAAGDSTALSQFLADHMQAEITDLLEAPCPQWIIPPGKGQMPVPNPDCAAKENDRLRREKETRRKQREELQRQKGFDIVSVLLVVGIGYLAFKKWRAS